MTRCKNISLKLLEYGCIVNKKIVVAAARWLAVVTEPSHLVERGGPATLSVPWAKSLLKLMNFTKRWVSTRWGNPSENIEGVWREFLWDIVEARLVSSRSYFQLGILLVPSAQWTMDKKGRKKVPIAGHNDKRQITAVMCGALTGVILPIYQGKTKRCHPPFEFPQDWLISHSPSH